MLRQLPLPHIEPLSEISLPPASLTAITEEIQVQGNQLSANSHSISRWNARVLTTMGGGFISLTACWPLNPQYSVIDPESTPGLYLSFSRIGPRAWSIAGESPSDADRRFLGELAKNYNIPEVWSDIRDLYLRNERFSILCDALRDARRDAMGQLLTQRLERKGNSFIWEIHAVGFNPSSDGLVHLTSQLFRCAMNRFSKFLDSHFSEVAKADLIKGTVIVHLGNEFYLNSCEEFEDPLCMAVVGGYMRGTDRVLDLELKVAPYLTDSESVQPFGSLDVH